MNAPTNLPARLVYNGEVIRDRGEMLSLTDMWKAAGSPDGRRPDDWKKDGANRAFLDHVALITNAPVEGIWRGRRGNNGGTFAHWQIALAYAKYLSPAFHAWCNEVVRERMEGRVVPAPIDLDEAARRAIGGIVKGVVHREIAEIVPALVEKQMLESQAGVVRGLTAGDVLDLAGVRVRKGLRGLAGFVSGRLRRFCAERGVPVKLASLGAANAYVFDRISAREWLDKGGRAEIERKVAERRGQTVLPFRKTDD